MLFPELLSLLPNFLKGMILTLMYYISFKLMSKLFIFLLPVCVLPSTSVIGTIIWVIHDSVYFSHPSVSNWYFCSTFYISFEPISSFPYSLPLPLFTSPFFNWTTTIASYPVLCSQDGSPQSTLHSATRVITYKMMSLSIAHIIKFNPLKLSCNVMHYLSSHYLSNLIYSFCTLLFSYLECHTISQTFYVLSSFCTFELLTSLLFHLANQILYIFQDSDQISSERNITWHCLSS